MNFSSEKSSITPCVEYIREELNKVKSSRENRVRALLSLEEALNVMISKSRPGSEFSARVVNVLGNTTIRLRSVGESFDKSELSKQLDFGDDLEPEESIVVNRLIEKTTGDSLKIGHSRGINKCTIKIEKSELNSIFIIFGALLGGVLMGLLLKFIISPEFASAAADNIFTPFYTMFLNALKMIVGPLVFLSIANSVAGFDDIRALGKIAGKVFGCYIITSLIAIGIGYVAYSIVQIGDTSLQSIVTDAARSTIEQSDSEDISIVSTLVNVIPSDIINPFLNLEMLQIIFMAILLGIAIAATGSDTPFARVISAANDVVLKMTAFIVKFLPISVFCSMASLISSTDFGKLAKVIVWVPSVYLGDFMMLIVYCILLLVIGRINPVSFIKKFSPAMITGFVTTSSNATMPVTLEMCEKRLGISPKVYAFSIPFGATVNMDGNCVTLIITALFMAKIFAVPVTAGIIASLVISIMALSIGSPGVPGGGLVSMAIIFPMIGVPAEALSIVMGLYCLVGMPQTVINVTGDAVVTTLVAKSEGLINMTGDKKSLLFTRRPAR